MKVFEYVILWHPTDNQKEDKDMKSKLLLGVKQVLAVDVKAATLAAAREIPNEYSDCLDQVEVAVRPF